MTPRHSGPTTGRGPQHFGCGRSFLAIASRLLPSHTTVRTGPYTAVRWIERIPVPTGGVAAGVWKRASARTFRSLHHRAVGFHPSVLVSTPDTTGVLPHDIVEMRVLLPTSSVLAFGGSLHLRPGRPATLLHASFRPRLATTPLRFANPSPPSGWIEDFHLQAVDHARHTNERPPGMTERPLQTR